MSVPIAPHLLPDLPETSEHEAEWSAACNSKNINIMDRSFADLNVGTQNITEPLQDIDRKVPTPGNTEPDTSLVMILRNWAWGKDDVEIVVYGGR